jgi:hypothetical protein
MLNRYMVSWGHERDGEYLAFLNPPKFAERLTLDDALTLAAWILAMADSNSAAAILESSVRTRFQEILTDVVSKVET